VPPPPIEKRPVGGATGLSRLHPCNSAQGGKPVCIIRGLKNGGTTGPLELNAGVASAWTRTIDRTSISMTLRLYGINGAGAGPRLLRLDRCCANPGDIPGRTATVTRSLNERRIPTPRGSRREPSRACAEARTAAIAALFIDGTFLGMSYTYWRSARAVAARATARGAVGHPAPDVGLALL
jgi:hypothetical protein